MSNIPEKTASYRSIFKATSLFGGVQVFNIIITVIRAKVVAILLGTEGMGLNGLFLNTTALIQNITGLGLNQSAIKNIAQANASNNTEAVAKVIAVFRKLIWYTALLSFAVAILMGNQLSLWVFGTAEHTWSFRILGITFIFGAITAGTFTVLQGLRKIKYLAAANILGSFLALVVSIPLYYYYGIQGVVPALVAAAFVSLLVSRYYRGKIDITAASITYKEAFIQGSDMIKLGLVLASSTFLASGVKFVISAFITRTGSLSDLGLYNAGIAITMGYTGLVFTAMTQDYFPRLTEAVHKEGGDWRRIINDQTHLVTIILTPILVFILTVLPWMIKLLLSNDFMDITNFVSFFILGVFLQGPTWTMGVMIVAKSDLKVKMYSELFANILFLIISIFFYYYYGLIGIGFGFLLSKFFSLLITWSIVRFRYFFRFDRRESVILMISFLACSILSAIQILKGYPLTHYVGIGLFLISITFSVKELNQKIDIRMIIKEGMNRFKNR